MNSTSVHCIVLPVGHNLTHMTEGPKTGSVFTDVIFAGSMILEIF